MAVKKVSGASASNVDEAEASVQTAETKKLKAENTKLKKSVETLTTELEEIKKMVASLSSTSSNVQTTESISNEDILVCSLCCGSLSVGTESSGRGTVYNFETFGEEQEIPYGDLRDIVRNNRRFAEGGAFYIEDEKAVKKLRLGQAYKRCLSSEDMKDIMSKQSDEFMELYYKASELQKESIEAMLVEAKLKGQPVDANVLARVGEHSGKNLMDID